MPYVRRRSSGRYRRRSGKRYTRSRKARSRRSRYRKPKMSKWINPVRQSGLYKFEYAQAGFELDCTTVAGNKALNYFSGNSLFDPLYTGGGNQPYGLDQLMPGLFQIYKVHACKLTIFATLKTVDGSTIQSATVSIFPTLSGALTNDNLPDVRRLPKCKSINLCINSSQTGKVSQYVSTKYMYPNMSGEFGLRAQYSADPSYKWFFIVHGSSQRESQPCRIYYDVRIKYYAKLSRNTTIGPS